MYRSTALKLFGQYPRLTGAQIKNMFENIYSLSFEQMQEEVGKRQEIIDRTLLIIHLRAYKKELPSLEIKRALCDYDYCKKFFVTEKALCENRLAYLNSLFKETEEKLFNPEQLGNSFTGAVEAYNKFLSCHEKLNDWRRYAEPIISENAARSKGVYVDIKYDKEAYNNYLKGDSTQLKLYPSKYKSFLMSFRYSIIKRDVEKAESEARKRAEVSVSE